MLANIVCWGLALGLMFCRNGGISGDNEKMFFAMGFIFLGILSKLVDYYGRMHVSRTKEEEKK